LHTGPPSAPGLRDVTTSLSHEATMPPLTVFHSVTTIKLLFFIHY